MEINKMKYRDMLGFPKKKAKKVVAPKPISPPITELLKGEFGQLNECSIVNPGPKRWSGAYSNNDSGLTEFERKGGKDSLNERDPVTQADFDKDTGIKVGKIQQLRYSDWGKYIEFNTGNNLVSLGKKELEAIFKIYKKYKSKIK